MKKKMNKLLDPQIMSTCHPYYIIQGNIKSYLSSIILCNHHNIKDWTTRMGVKKMENGNNEQGSMIQSAQ